MQNTEKKSRHNIIICRTLIQSAYTQNHRGGYLFWDKNDIVCVCVRDASRISKIDDGTEMKHTTHFRNKKNFMKRKTVRSRYTRKNQEKNQNKTTRKREREKKRTDRRQKGNQMQCRPKIQRCYYPLITISICNYGLDALGTTKLPHPIYERQ